MRCLPMLILFAGALSRLAAQDTLPGYRLLLGRWEVVRYHEQGVPVDKRLDPLPQAQAVYRHLQEERARMYYGYDYRWEEGLQGRRAAQYLRWIAEDSAREVQRIAAAIRDPYFAVFFADSTLSLYNKDPETGLVSHPEAWRYVYAPATSSLDLHPASYQKWEGQILLLTAQRMRLYLPQEAEAVELEKRDGTLP
ncbi:MAG: hypothetical protein NW241_16715 [Bacteroidia bacterium]|nr:hypothetical protein [Bacteroidia bacterium]